MVDEARNVGSCIHSHYAGNGVVAGDTGILLNNRMCCFSLDENSSNRVAPGKRPIHTLNSGMLLQNGTPQVVGSTPGSFWQVQTNLQLISNLIDLAVALQAAMEAASLDDGQPDLLDGRPPEPRGSLRGGGHPFAARAWPHR